VLFSLWVTFASGYQAVYQALFLVLAGLVRPVASPADPDVIVNACESAPYRLSHDVRRHDRFWIKGQPYSVAHMLADDPWADQFVGGTIYQAFLSALSYHRWHSRSTAGS
jgi:phosphatidylserine decarboxylase